MKISIVMASYNYAPIIGEAIESVINQTYKDWELIIVNDCSADETPQIAAEYAKKDDSDITRIRYYEVQ